MKKVLVCGAGGFIGGHLVDKLNYEGHEVTGTDIRLPKFKKTTANRFIQGDLRSQEFCKRIFETSYDEVYQLAANMGGASFIFTGENDANIMHNSSQINLNILDNLKEKEFDGKVFFSSSACIYPEFNQLDPLSPNCAEDSAYPAHPDSNYGWEKLFSERLYLAYSKNYGIECRIARFHNIFGEYTEYEGGKEKAPAAICRKIAKANQTDTIEIFGDGNQTRTFLYINECLKGIEMLMDSDYKMPINIGSTELISINDLVNMVAKIAKKDIQIKHIDGPLGVRGRSSDNRLIQEKLGWSPGTSIRLIEGMEKLYSWVNSLINRD